VNHTETKSVFILLTTNPDPISWLFRLLTFGKYSHASIGIEEHLDHFFSFVTKDGFYLERPLKSKKAKKRARECALYRLDVDDDKYEAIKSKIEEFQTHTVQFHYSYLGILLLLFRIPHQFKNRYFCSQFVSELLTLTGSAQLQRKPSVYRPDDFRWEPMLRLGYQGTLGELAEVF